jgi:hypothetical protein
MCHNINYRKNELVKGNMPRKAILNYQIDWLQYTINNHHDYDFHQELIEKNSNFSVMPSRSPMPGYTEMMEVLFSDGKPFFKIHYPEKKGRFSLLVIYNQIFYLYDVQHIVAILCDVFQDEFDSFFLSRIDIAFDDSTNFIRDIAIDLYRGEITPKSYNGQCNLNITRNMHGDIETMYINKRTADKQICIYNKTVENLKRKKLWIEEYFDKVRESQNIHKKNDVWRYEIRLKKPPHFIKINNEQCSTKELSNYIIFNLILTLDYRIFNYRYSIKGLNDMQLCETSRVHFSDNLYYVK